MSEHPKTKAAYVIAAVAGVLLLGTLVFHALEKWSYVDALYFSAATISTVGYGDLSPTHDASKLVAILYMFFGIAVMLYAFRVIGEYVVEKRIHGLQGKRHGRGYGEETEDANPLQKRRH